jgi:hypothetical protein
MFLIACFLLGIGNFAMHKAVLESRHPFVEDSKLYFGQHFGKRTSYVIELVLLAGAMLMAHEGVLWIVWGYMAYSALNGIAAWLLLSGKI